MKQLYAITLLVAAAATASTVMPLRNASAAPQREAEVSVQPWSQEIDAPGLGLSHYGYGYVITIGDTKIGAYPYDSDRLAITGFNTTDSSVEIPESVTINDNVYHVNYLGYPYDNDWKFDWTGAQSLTALHLDHLDHYYGALNGSSVTDLYVSSLTYEWWAEGDNSDTYLHVPYDFNTDFWGYFGYWNFKRVLVGDETPDYPESDYAHWFIPGENDGEYFGIRHVRNGEIAGEQVDDAYCVVSIYTDREAIELPKTTPIGNGNAANISGLGVNYQNGEICKNAPALTTLSVPENYSSFGMNWGEMPNVKCLHMNNPEPARVSEPLWDDITVYVPSYDAYLNYVKDGNWANADLCLESGEFPVTEIEVGTPGEFAQQIVESDEYDWDNILRLKVTGELNAGDLLNIKNITYLKEVDLSGATFEELPEHFLENSRVKKVTLPDFVTKVPADAFQYCYKLSEVNLDNVKYVDHNAFESCYNLDLSEYIPNFISIGSNAFVGTSTAEAIFSEELKEIPYEAFRDCRSLKKVLIPESVTRLGSRAFSGCSSLEEVDIKEGLTEMEHGVFASCYSLNELSLPSTLQRFYLYEYYEDNFNGAVKTIKCKASVPPIADDYLVNGLDLNNVTLYVPSFAIEAYRNAPGWTRFYIMKNLQEPVSKIVVNRPTVMNLQSDDAFALESNPLLLLEYDRNTGSVGQLEAKGDGTLSASNFELIQEMGSRDYWDDHRVSLVNDAENMRANEVRNTITFEKDRWHFISFPYDVNVADIQALDNADFVIRYYDSESRAAGNTGNWKNVAADGTLKAYQGYILQTSNYNDAVIKFPAIDNTNKNNIFAHEAVSVPLNEYQISADGFAHNYSWNLIGNPYPCYYDMSILDDASKKLPIVIWRGDDYQGYRPIDDDVVLRPNESFFMQRPTSGEITAIEFVPSGRMQYDDAMQEDRTPGARIPAAKEAPAEGRHVFNFLFEGNDRDSRARIVLNEESSRGYETECDVPKFFAESCKGIESYVNDGIKYDICERPLDDAKAVIGLRVAADGEYTLSLNGRNTEGWSVMLTDNATGRTVDLSAEAYTFEAKAGEAASRFSVEFRAPGITAIENLVAESGNVEVTIVNLNGIVVYQGLLGDFHATLPGVYVVSTPSRSYKVVVK